MKTLYVYTGTDFGNTAFATADPEADWQNYVETCLTGEAIDGGAVPTPKLRAEFLACFRPWNPDDKDDVKLARESGLLSAAAELGHRGGSSTSPAKRRSSAANGKLGGRPSKK